MKTVITNATIVAHDKISHGEISFEKGLITEIGQDVNKDNAKIIDAKDCFVLPGCVDIHTHLACDAKGEVNKDAYKQNSLAALYGGTTTIIEEIDPAYVKENALKEYNELLKENSYIDYAFHQVPDGENLKDMGELARNGFPSTCMQTYGEDAKSDAAILKILREFSLYGATAFIKCESAEPIKLLEELHTIKNRLAPYALASTRPNYTESEAFTRIANLSRAGNVTFCAANISTKDVVDILANQVHEGLPISVSVNPLHLLFNEDVYKTNQETNMQAYKYLVHPPLRQKQDQEALWKGIQSGIVHFVSSNHKGVHLKTKLENGKDNVLNSPVGAPGVELRLALLHTFGVLRGIIDMQKLVEITASHVTRIAGLRSKGRIEAGTDADILIFDPKHKKKISLENLHEDCDYSPYEGMELQGFAKHVFLRGEQVIENFELKEKEAKGKLTLRKPIAMR